jgi:hypothetical protein
MSARPWTVVSKVQTRRSCKARLQPRSGQGSATPNRSSIDPGSLQSISPVERLTVVPSRLSGAIVLVRKVAPPRFGRGILALLARQIAPRRVLLFRRALLPPGLKTNTAWIRIAKPNRRFPAQQHHSRRSRGGHARVVARGDPTTTSGNGAHPPVPLLHRPGLPRCLVWLANQAAAVLGARAGPDAEPARGRAS